MMLEGKDNMNSARPIMKTKCLLWTKDKVLVVVKSVIIDWSVDIRINGAIWIQYDNLTEQINM